MTNDSDLRELISESGVLGYAVTVSCSRVLAALDAHDQRVAVTQIDAALAALPRLRRKLEKAAEAVGKADLCGALLKSIEAVHGKR